MTNGRLPPLHQHLLDSGVLSSTAADALLECGIATLADLQAPETRERIDRLLGTATASRLTSSAREFSQRTLITLGRATEILELLESVIRDRCRSVSSLTAAGAVRRYEPLVSGLVLIGSAPDPPAVLEQICDLEDVEDVLHRTSKRAVVVWRRSEVDVRVVTPGEYGSILFTATGAAKHTQTVNARRKHGGPAVEEEDIYREAGLPFIAPELRNATGEIEWAAAGQLPVLVDGADIRGDLHMHTIFSDGQDTVEAMVAACARIGYEYIAITDHSESEAASRTVSRYQLPRQRDEINRLRALYPQITILHGIEVDILPDGRLDLADAVLEQLDIVLASLHDHARQDPATLTRRCLAAIDHPLVNVITHPATQLVGRRGGYALDFAAVYAAAAATGTALEIDGAPSHLDLDGDHARAAVAAGVTVTIDSDCHRAAALERQMRFGIGTARRGWVETAHVLNARPLHEVRAFIEAKRSRRSG
ncbi:DNA polymerase/3'-5' exonuclease PolX [soil metagenome]